MGRAAQRATPVPRLHAAAGAEDDVAALLRHIEARSRQCRKRIRSLDRRQAEAAGDPGRVVQLAARAAVLHSEMTRLEVAASLAEVLLVDSPPAGPSYGLEP